MTMRAVGRKSEERMARGSLLKLRRKCGKKNCRCVEGDLHESWVVSYSIGGRTKMLLVPEEELGTAKKAMAYYRKAMEELKNRGLIGIERMRRDWSVAKRGR